MRAWRGSSLARACSWRRRGRRRLKELGHFGLEPRLRRDSTPKYPISFNLSGSRPPASAVCWDMRLGVWVMCTGAVVVGAQTRQQAQLNQLRASDAVRNAVHRASAHRARARGEGPESPWLIPTGNKPTSMFGDDQLLSSYLTGYAFADNTTHIESCSIATSSNCYCLTASLFRSNVLRAAHEMAH